MCCKTARKTTKLNKLTEASPIENSPLNCSLEKRRGEGVSDRGFLCLFWSDFMVCVCSADRNFYPDSHLKQQLYRGDEEP